MTTDLMEGVMFDPISLHRYAYGNDSPINFIDPSGQSNVTETLIAAALINVLAGISVHNNIFGLQDIYATLAKYILPDAYLVGAQINVSAGAKYSATEWRTHINDVIKTLNSALTKIQIPLLSTERDIDAVEILFSISSAEMAVFTIEGWNSLPGYAGASFYEAVVFNLWNAENYKGPFASIGWSPISLFGSPDSFFLGGPWGISNDLFSIGGSMWGKFSGHLTQYTLWGAIGGESEWEVLLAIIPINCMLNWLSQYGNPITNSIVATSPITNIIATSTFWTQTAIAKHYWNKREGYSVKQRQSNSRPSRFQSGPASPSFIGVNL